MEIGPVAIDGFSFAMLAIVVFFIVRNAKKEIINEIKKIRKDLDVEES